MLAVGGDDEPGRGQHKERGLAGADGPPERSARSTILHPVTTTESTHSAQSARAAPPAARPGVPPGPAPWAPLQANDGP